MTFPTATDDVLGTGKWGIGPSGVVVYTPGDWVLGALVNNVWGAGGDSAQPLPPPTPDQRSASTGRDTPLHVFFDFCCGCLGAH